MRGPRRSAIWAAVFESGYWFLRLADPLVRAVWHLDLPWLSRLIDLRVAGRRTGRRRSTILTRLTVGQGTYIGHPNGPAAWTRNLNASGTADIVTADGRVAPARAVRLEMGPERDDVIGATWIQQPFPANALYFLARRHVRAMGVYFRLEPAETSTRRRAPDEPAAGAQVMRSTPKYGRIGSGGTTDPSGC
jgi:hypothetical protein